MEINRRLKRIITTASGVRDMEDYCFDLRSNIHFSRRHVVRVYNLDIMRKRGLFTDANRYFKDRSYHIKMAEYYLDMAQRYLYVLSMDAISKKLQCGGWYSIEQGISNG